MAHTFEKGHSTGLNVGDTGTISTTTPTGHTHRGHPPPPPASPPWIPRETLGFKQPAKLQIEIHWPTEMAHSRR